MSKILNNVSYVALLAMISVSQVNAAGAAAAAAAAEDRSTATLVSAVVSGGGTGGGAGGAAATEDGRAVATISAADATRMVAAQDSSNLLTFYSIWSYPSASYDALTRLCMANPEDRPMVEQLGRDFDNLIVYTRNYYHPNPSAMPGDREELITAIDSIIDRVLETAEKYNFSFIHYLLPHILHNEEGRNVYLRGTETYLSVLHRKLKEAMIAKGAISADSVVDPYQLDASGNPWGLAVTSACDAFKIKYSSSLPAHLSAVEALQKLGNATTATLEGYYTGLPTLEDKQYMEYNNDNPSEAILEAVSSINATATESGNRISAALEKTLKIVLPEALAMGFAKEMKAAFSTVTDTVTQSEKDALEEAEKLKVESLLCLPAISQKIYAYRKTAKQSYPMRVLLVALQAVEREAKSHIAAAASAAGGGAGGAAAAAAGIATPA